MVPTVVKLTIGDLNYTNLATNMQTDDQTEQAFFIYHGKDLLRPKLSLTSFLSSYRSSKVTLDDIIRSRQDPNSPLYQQKPLSSIPVLNKTTLSGGCSLLTHSSSPPPSPTFLLHGPSLSPQVYQDSTGSLCVFVGSLNNLNELAEVYLQTVSPFSTNENNDGESMYEEDDTFDDAFPKPYASGHHHHPALAAQVLLAMYTKEVSSPSYSNSSTFSTSISSSGCPFIMLSEIQGQYAFLIHDADKRQVLAARDSTGTWPLYYSMTEDDDVWVASSPLYIPPPSHRGGGFLSSTSSSSGQISASSPTSPLSLSQGGRDGAFHTSTTAIQGAVTWEELPAGYCIFGRRPAKVMQFALSQEQLSMKELELDKEDEKALYL